MARLLNVRRDVDDAFYRYKMERIQTKIEGKGNGIKTVVTNLSAVAHALARPSSYVIKFFGFELGAQTNTDRCIINGAHDSSKLQDYLDGFINKFVLCKACKNPETDVDVTDENRIILQCKACGERTPVNLSMKMSSYILKNQPKKGKKEKADRKAARKARQQKDAEANGNGTGDEGVSEHGSDPKADPKADKSDEGISDEEVKKVDADDGDIPIPNIPTTKVHEWSVDTSAEAVKARQAILSSDLKQKLNLDDEDEDGEGSGITVYDDLGVWIQKSAEEKGGIDSVDSIDIYLKAKELGIESQSRTVTVLVQTIFNKNICAQIPKRASILKQIVSSERHEKALLGGTERLISVEMETDPDFLPQIVKILQLYYNYDLLSEEVAKKWAVRTNKKYVEIAVSKKIHKAAEPFMTWLAEADEESEESEEEE